MKKIFSTFSMKAMSVMGVCALVATSLLTSCDKQELDFARMAPRIDSTEVPVPGYTIERSLTHQWDSVARTSITDAMTAPMTVWRTEDGIKTSKLYENTARPRLVVKSSLLRDDYNITKDQLNIVPMDYQLKRAETAEALADVERDTCVWSFVDAQVFTVPVEVTNHYVDVAGTRYYHGSLTLVSAEFVKLTNTERGATTRAMYVSNSYDTEYLAKLLFREKNVSSPKDFTVYVHQYAIRHLLDEDGVKEQKVENKDRVVVDATTERCSFDIVNIYKSGETTRESRQIILNRLFKGIADYNKDVDNFNYSFASSNGVKVGTSAQARTEGSWTVSGRTDGYGANLRNNVAADNVVTSYSLYHEAAVYQDGNIKVEFGFEPVNVTEVQTKVTGATSDREGFEKAILSNEIGTTYMGYNQNLSENVNLFKVKPVIKITDYEVRNPKIVITRDKVTTSLTFVTKFSDGHEETDNVSKDFARNFSVLTNWGVYSANANQTTGAATVTLANSESKKDGEWSYVVETRNINTTATLASSTQNNGWRSVDPNKIVFSRNGKTYDFGTISFTATESGATVAQTGDDVLETVYAYTDKISVKYGENSFEATAPGTIKVEKPWTPDFPAEWGKFTDIKFTNARNEQRNSWIYVLSIHFQNGTLPLIVRNNFAAPEVNFSYFENDTNPALNSASWVPSWGKWINTVASNKSSSMIWLTSGGVGADTFSYTGATAINWDYGYTENDHPSVYTDKFKAEITREGSLLTIYHDGKVFAQYKAVR